MRLGVLDIGSNTVHLLLVEAYPGARPVAFASHKRPLSLVRFLDEKGAINQRGRRELLNFVSEAVSFARRHGVQDLLAFCTSALRGASNGAAVITEVEATTGVTLEELSGEQEASMTYFAVRRWFGWDTRDLMVLDIGGGSFEMATGRDEFPAAAVSVPLGAARLTKDMLPGNPPAPSSVAALREYVARTLKGPVKALAEQQSPDLVAATSKTFRSLARVAGAAPSGAGPYVTRILRRDDLRLWSRRLEALSFEERASLAGVSEIRAPQLLAGAIVAETAMEALDVDEVRVCPWALREGLILHRFDRLMRDHDVVNDAYVGVGSVDLLSRDVNQVPQTQLPLDLPLSQLPLDLPSAAGSKP
ncbi:Ppx/GppA phosphatase family protein [Galactobacter caseinivorans]|uniref:Ppx/GppA family phosphatase n=1 Tax=Galactobacter caseinivorans TaxID=2676123 RepID=A0A496PLJ7_9MICC|nr:Ppx/GppA family phosphatase [Galactobacter caseinivorans]RKW71336.1 Ppx/GppA family phosphatase [Galactobacter caseinivorans]